MDLDPMEEKIILAGRDEKKLASNGKMDLAANVLSDVVDWRKERLMKVAARILWAIHHRQKEM